MDRDTERKIARDLDLCDLVSAIGAPRARAKAETFRAKEHNTSTTPIARCDL